MKFEEDFNCDGCFGYSESWTFTFWKAFPVIGILMGLLAHHSGCPLFSCILCGIVGAIMFYLPVRVGIMTASVIIGIIAFLAEMFVFFLIKPIGMIAVAVVSLLFFVSDLLEGSGWKNTFFYNNFFDSFL